MEKRWRFMRELLNGHDGLFFVFAILMLISGASALVLNICSLANTNIIGEPASYTGLRWVALPFDVVFLLVAVPSAWYGLCYLKYEWWPDFVEDANRIARGRK